MKLTSNSEASSDATIHEHEKDERTRRRRSGPPRARIASAGGCRRWRGSSESGTAGGFWGRLFGCSSANVTLTVLVSLDLELRTLHDSLWIT